MQSHDVGYVIYFRDAVLWRSLNRFQNAKVCGYSRAVFEFEFPDITEGAHGFITIDRPNCVCDLGKNCLNLKCHFNKTNLRSFIENNQVHKKMTEDQFMAMVQAADDISREIKDDFDPAMFTRAGFYQCPIPYYAIP